MQCDLGKAILLSRISFRCSSIARMASEDVNCCVLVRILLTSANVCDQAFLQIVCILMSPRTELKVEAASETSHVSTRKDSDLSGIPRSLQDEAILQVLYG